MFDSVINLLIENTSQDEIGQVIKSYDRKAVFANKKSITQNEFYSSKKISPYMGIRDSFCFEINLLDYNGEESLEYNDKIYKIYRIYEKGEIIELYCEMRGGLNNGKNHS